MKARLSWAAGIGLVLAALMPSAVQAEGSATIKGALDDFVQRLEEWPGVSATWEREIVSREVRYKLHVGPRYRRDQERVMLSLTERNGGVYDPASRQELCDGDELANYLDGILSNTSLPSSLDEFSEIAQEPVEGWLKLGGGDASLDDVAVSLSREQLEAFASRIESGRPLQMTLDLEPLPVVGRFRPYNDATAYTAFIAGGYLVEITRHVRDGDSILIDVRRRP